MSMTDPTTVSNNSTNGNSGLAGQRHASWIQSFSSASQNTSTRVCNRCIVKVKCNLNRPACSRCVEDGISCVYGSIKRKPGPSRGFRPRKLTSGVPARKPRTPTSSAVPGNNVLCAPLPAVLEVSLPISRKVSVRLDSGVSLPHIPGSSLNATPSQVCLVDLRLESLQERQLIENFFEYIHGSIMLFRRDEFVQQYENGTVDRGLLITIFIISLTALDRPIGWSNRQIENCIASLLEADTLNEEGPAKSPSLDSFRQACLLAFFEFHQYPGEGACTRITQLTRKAYQYGLNQIDSRGEFAGCIRRSANQKELEEWRCVWWCIYCLDSYANITAATPFVIEAESIMTALITSSFDEALSRPLDSMLFLSEIDLLWETTQAIKTDSAEFNFNMHIVTTTLLREASTARRLYRLNSSKRYQDRLSACRDHISAVRLALPAYFVNPARNAMVDESGRAHHARLVCLLHLHTARLLAGTASSSALDVEDWSCQWQGTLEHCQDIVSVIRQWNGQFSSTVDPAVCFAITVVLVLLHLHSIHHNDSQHEIKKRLHRDMDILVLFLRQFETIWTLPRFLLLSFEKLSQLVPGPLSDTEIQKILVTLQGPLNFKWMTFLSLSLEEYIAKPITSVDSQPPIAQEWDFNDWEPFANLSGFDDWTNSF